LGWRTNAEVPGPELRRRGWLPHDAGAILERQLRTGAMTARGADRALRVAFTIADLRGAPGPELADVVEAVGFKGFVDDDRDDPDPDGGAEGGLDGGAGPAGERDGAAA
jgi:magnesium chelatase family protein